RRGVGTVLKTHTSQGELFMALPRAVRVGLVRGFLVLPLLTAWSGVLAAQSAGTVGGPVSDQQPGQPLAGARVYVVGSLTVALSRGDGTYRLTASAGSPGVRVGATASPTGRATVTVTAGAPVTQNFPLDRAAGALEEVAVTGPRRAERTAVDQ